MAAEAGVGKRPLLETLLFTELAKHAEWADAEVGLYHFRDKRRREVDIVLERPDGRIVGVEVKASATVRREDFNGLAALAEVAGTAFEHGVLIYGRTRAPVPPGSVTHARGSAGGFDGCVGAEDPA